VKPFVIWSLTTTRLMVSPTLMVWAAVMLMVAALPGCRVRGLVLMGGLVVTDTATPLMKSFTSVMVRGTLPVFLMEAVMLPLSGTATKPVNSRAGWVMYLFTKPWNWVKRNPPIRKVAAIRMMVDTKGDMALIEAAPGRGI
jgi:hypothetical protein